MPPGIPGHVTSFPVGGKATPRITWKNRIPLTLTYDSTAPDAVDIATQIRTRLENSGGLSVQLRPDAPVADLWLLDRKAWTSTGLAWLQPYIDAPLPTAATTIQTIVTEYRKTTDGDAAAQLLGSLQKQAAVDNVLVPMSQSDEYLYARAGSTSATQGSGPAGSWGSTESHMVEQPPSGVRRGPFKPGADCPH